MKLNQKGVTLIEVLAVLMISGIVLGAISLLFMSVNLEWNTTTSKYQDDNQVRNTINTITNDLTDSTMVCVKEKQFLYLKSDGDVKRIRFEEGGKLYLESMLAPENTFLCDFVTSTNQVVLANNIASSPIFDDFTITNSNYTKIYGTGEKFTLTYKFNYTNYQASGKITSQEKVYKTTVKLFKEPIIDEEDDE